MHIFYFQNKIQECYVASYPFRFLFQGTMEGKVLDSLEHISALKTDTEESMR